MITCNVLTGDPPVNFKWLKDNRTLDVQTLDIQHSSVADLASALIFRNIGEPHAGHYTCIASNLVGEDAFTSEMVVKVKSNLRL
ncbi:Down syndrome cell adhesion molecule-like protein Dscam2 [Leptotrombidium deliense]|uniref:Down syndrome cell adhesion molecule-like protein Dscam2 n=1 Tax=Leptotrombidium deliense TaxID=299467 RepID=A0A443QA33_9ACAR|nr:Down syndrome cell adhesion molecule-like protein Dscam2 [Leptotrombidium deliense]